MAPLDALLARWAPTAGVLFGQEPRAHAKLLMNKEHGVACNAILISKPRHPFWLLMLRMIARHTRGLGGGDPVDSTGPRMLQKALARWQDDELYWEQRDPGVAVRMLPAEVFFPKLALWNRKDIFDKPCRAFPPRGGGGAEVDGKAGRSRVDERQTLCDTIRHVGWERYADGWLRTNETVAVHHWFFNWGMSRKTYDPQSTWPLTRVLALARDSSKPIDRNDFTPPPRPKKTTSKEPTTEKQDSIFVPRRIRLLDGSGRGDDQRNTEGEHWHRPSLVIPGITPECEPDKSKFCAKVKPGGHRTHACLEAAKKEGKLSAACNASATFAANIAPSTVPPFWRAGAGADADIFSEGWPTRAPTPPPPSLPHLNFSALAAAAAWRHGGARWRGQRCEVPKVVHWTWKSRHIQALFAPYVESWLTLNPGWVARMWTDADSRELIRTAFPELLQQFDSYTTGIQRADLVRYVILYEAGGVYVDLDFEALRPIAPLLANRSLVLGHEPEAHAYVLQHEARGLVCNALMASCQGHPFWLRVLDVARQKSQIMRGGEQATPEAVLESTGPKMLTQAVVQYDAEQRAQAAQITAKPPMSLAAADVLLPPLHVMPSVSFFPDFDEENTNLRKKCQDWPERCGADARLLANALSPLACENRKRACAALRALNFKNAPLTNASYATHHWSHTWLAQIHDRCLVSFDEIARRGNWSKGVAACRKRLAEESSAVDPWSSLQYGVGQDVETGSYVAYQEHLWDGILGITAECEPDKIKFCAKVKPGGHRTHTCLEAAKKEGKLSAACNASATFAANVLTELQPHSFKSIGTRAPDSVILAITDECKDDRYKFCAKVKPGRHRTHTCLEAARAAGKLSAACNASATFAVNIVPEGGTKHRRRRHAIFWGGGGGRTHP